MAVKRNDAINQWWCDAIFTHSTQIVRGFAHGMIESCSVARTTKKKALLTEYSPKLHRGGAPFEDSPQVIERRRENKAARPQVIFPKKIKFYFEKKGANA